MQTEKIMSNPTAMRVPPLGPSRQELRDTSSRNCSHQPDLKFANILGNKFFGLLFPFLFDQRIKDTLCGTKALWRKDWLRLEPYRARWGIKDLWGDYELLFCASKLHLDIVGMRVHYQERVHGVTKMTKVFSN